MWDLPRPGLEPMYPAWAGRFLTTVPPGKPPTLVFKKQLITALKNLKYKDTGMLKVVEDILYKLTKRKSVKLN